MKKSLPFVLLLTLISFNATSQDFLGISTGNFGGVTGVLLQPASIVDSRYKFDINLFSTGTRYSNNYYLVNRDAILKFNKNNFDDYQTFKSKYLSAASLQAGEKAFFNITNRTQLPLSFMATINKKSAIALNFQSRSMIQGRNITPELAKLAYDGFYSPALNNQPLDASGLTVKSMSWIEAGLTFGHVLFSSDQHFLKGAFTAKYLGGVASLNIGTNDFRIGVNSDSSINFDTRNFSYNHNKNADFDMVFDKAFRPDANALGFDAGLVYEFRGNLDQFKYIRNDDEVSYVTDRRDVNKYIVKLGVSLLDAGMFTFKNPSNVGSFSGNVTGWDVRNANYNTLKEFDTALANRVMALPNRDNQYNMYLPGALSVQLDIRFVKGLYLNAMAYRPLKMGGSAGNRFDNYGYYSITPRYERRHFGVYIPYSIADKNSITNYRENRLGATIRVGPLFIGSSNLGTMAFKKNLKAADVHVGLKVGFTYGRPSKVSRFFTRSNATDYTFSSGVKMESIKDTIAIPIATIAPAAGKMIVDYSKGQVYSSDKNGQIIIINNYYYGNNAAPAKDSVYVIPAVQMVAATDAYQKVIKDSILQKKVQLDSLIEQLQLLRLQIDSTTIADSLRVKAVIEKGLPSNALTNTKESAIAATADTAVTKVSKSVLNNVGTGYPKTLPVQQTLQNDSLTARQESKKKIVAGYDTSVARANNKATAAKPIGKQADIIVTTPVYTQPTRNTNYDDVYRGYARESNRLMAEISSLQRQLISKNFNPGYKETPGSRNDYAAVTPVMAVNLNSPVPSPNKRDTVYLRDTIRIADTIRLTTSDTLIRITPAITNTVYVPVNKEKIVKERIDYTKLPAETVLFSLGKSNIRAVYNNKLAFLAGILKKNPNLALSITGHTDKTGSVKVNEALSLKRATAVKTYFSNKGINESRLPLTALASEQPIADGNNDNANSQNRRVVIQIIEQAQ